MRVDDVVAALVYGLGLDPAKAAKVKRHYQRLEQGLLDAGGVSERVWEVLARVLPGARQLVRVVPPPAAPAQAYFRAESSRSRRPSPGRSRSPIRSTRSSA